MEETEYRRGIMVNKMAELMGLGSLLEIIVLVAIVLEIYSLIRHSKLEKKVEKNMERLDDHIKQLDKHITQQLQILQLEKHHSTIQNPQPSDKE